MNDWTRVAPAMLALLLTACSRTEQSAATAAPASAPYRTAATSPAAFAAATPAPASGAGAASATPAASRPAPAAASVDVAALTAQLWRVIASDAVAAGSLYAFLPDRTLLVGTPGSALAPGRWRLEGGRLVMLEDSRAHPADVLELGPARLRLRSHNPGPPVEMTLAAVDAAAPVPQKLRGEWAGQREACGQAGHETRLRIDATTLRFHESSGTVLAAIADPADPARVALVARLSGEGSTRLAWRRFRLGADGSTLADITDAPPGGLVRVRCGAR